MVGQYAKCRVRFNMVSNLDVEDLAVTFSMPFKLCSRYVV